MLLSPIVVDLETGKVVKQSSLSKTNILKLTSRDLQVDLISGGINKSSYIFMMLKLLFGSQDSTVDLVELADFLSCSGVTPLGVDKEINITVDDIQIELAKFKKKGLLANSETIVQLKLSDLK